MHGPAFERLIAFLSSPEAYPEGGPVELRETHISAVFLTPTRAFKLLKPVDFGFLDFTQVETRRATCEIGLTLNRRLAPDVYQTVVPVTERNGALEIDGAGPPVDWLLVMRRLPDDATLAARVAAGTATTVDVDRLLAVLLPFFASAARGPTIDADAHPSRVRQRLVDNVDAVADPEALEALGSRLVERFRSASLGFLETRRPSFERRIAEGRIRDGHGDLRAEHVYLLDPPAVIDCIDFRDEFRHLDTLDEVCFLAMDLERLGRPDLAAHLLTAYRTQARDPAPDALVAFFEAYRDSVRAKVARLRASEQVGAERDASFAAARDELRRATERLRPFSPPHLVAVCGLSGVGKSTVAHALAVTIGALVLRSDVVRKELFDVAPLDRGDVAVLYSAEATRRTYQALHDRAAATLADGVTTILDATYLRRADRDGVRALARAMGVAPLFVECVCPVDVVEDRLRRRSALGTDPSDADVAVFRRQRERFEPLDETPVAERLVVDARRPATDLVREIVDRLASRIDGAG